FVRSATVHRSMLLVKKDFLMLDITLSGLTRRGRRRTLRAITLPNIPTTCPQRKEGKYQNARRETGPHAPGIRNLRSYAEWLTTEGHRRPGFGICEGRASTVVEGHEQ